MKIALIGASGNAGSRIAAELSTRGHEVTAIARNADRIARLPGVTPLAVDIAAHPNMVAYCAAEGYELRQLDSHSPEAAALFEGRSFDLAMIDGDHSEPGFAADFNLVRDRSRIIAFHDATNRGYPWIQSFYENWPGKKHGYFEQYGINEEYKPQYGIAVFEMEAG